MEAVLAIGDGSNDVAMIHKASIGVGIYGKEGTEAASNADYAIHEFRHLRRLILFWGSNTAYKVTYFSLMILMKGSLRAYIAVFFCFDNGFSG